MARVNLDDADKYSGGGSSFFKLDDGEKKSVRFLYNTLQEVKEAALSVHEFTGSKYATIDCCRLTTEEPVENCKWCAGGNRAVLRIVIPIFSIEDNEIQYWKRSGSFVNDNLIPLFENLPVGAPIAGQTFTLSRTGKDWKDTKYQVAPDMRVPNDNKTKDQFGEIKDPFELNIIKPNDFDFEPEVPAQSQNAQPQQATRRTADVF